LLTKLYNEDGIMVSVQVLNELHFNMILTAQTYTKAFQVRKKYYENSYDSDNKMGFELFS
jgi:predicted nucleic acid-binding protein